MSSRKPPPRTRPPEDERKIQLFLERAAPIVLDCRVLDAEHWAHLSELAEELELTGQQLQETVEDLRQRGVIEKIDLQPPKPPPLPTPPQHAGSSQPAEAPPKVDEQFALTAPPPLPRANGGTSDAGSTEQRDNRAEFTRRVQTIIAEHRGLSVKAQPLIAAAAQELDIPDQVVREVLRGESGPASDAGDEDPSRRRWRTNEQPEPAASPAKQRPKETFQDFVAQTLTRLGKDTVSRKVEDSLVRHGVKVLRLSDVYARHIVQDVGREKGLTIESQQDQVIEPAPEMSAEEQRFCDRAASILAEHRGINAKSRVLLSALGRENGLSEEQVEAAIATLQSQAASSTSNEQDERLAAFHKYLRAQLTKLPKGILLPNAAERLTEQGEERFGLEPDLVGPAIQQTATELKLSVVSKQEAIKHIEYLLDYMLGNGIRLKAQDREKVFAEGAQWGLAAVTVDRILYERTHTNYRQRRSEQKLANLAIVAGASALTLVLAFGAWTMLDQTTPRPVPEPPSPVVESLVVNESSPDRDTSWWDGPLSTAAARCRADFRSLQPTINEIGSVDPQRRAAAYERLVRAFLEVEDSRKKLLLELLSRCYAQDPSDSAADRLAAELLRVVPGPEDQLLETPDSYPKAFWALRGAIAALSESVQQSALTDETVRAARMSTQIGQEIGSDVDESLPRSALERDCLTKFAEHLFRLLLFTVEAQPRIVPGIHSAIASEAAKYLDPMLLDRLNAQYLVGVLEETGEQWEAYKELIEQTIDSADVFAVAEMVGLFERTASEQLREFMEELLRERTGVRQPAPELADEFLRRLGVRPDATAVGRKRRYAALVRQEQSYLESDAADPEALLRRSVRLCWLATLGCALSQGKDGAETFQELVDRGPAKLPESDTRGERFRGRTLPDRTAVTQILKHLRALEGGGPIDGRIGALAGLIAKTDRLLDLTPRQAGGLANYLLRQKSQEEFDRVLARAGKLGSWKNVLLAVADRIDDSRLTPERRCALVEQLAGTTVDWKDDQYDSEVGRFLLLQRALQDESADQVDSQQELFDAARDAIFEEYRTQARLLGVTGRSDSVADRLPSSMLPGLIEWYARKLAAEGNLRAREIVADLPEQLIATEYRAGGDLFETILLERQWLELLSIGARAVNPDAADQVEETLQELRNKENEAANLLVQMRDGQMAVVVMWNFVNATSRAF